MSGTWWGRRALARAAKPLRTFSVTIPLTLEVIARDEREARTLMGEHLREFPPDWLGLRVHDSDVTVTVVEDVGQSINEGRYEDEED